MFFSRKKKLLRDRQAGLAFHWRGGQDFQSPKVISLIITSVVFAAALYAVKITSIRPPVIPLREGSVVMINHDDPHSQKLIMQVEHLSPFVARWDPALSPSVLKRIKEKAKSFIDPSTPYEAPLMPLPHEVEPDRLAALYDHNTELFIFNDKKIQAAPSSQGGASTDVSVSALFTLHGNIKGRLLQDSYVLPEFLITEDVYGQSFKFVLALDTKGHVYSCLPVTGSALASNKPTAYQKLIASWLKLQKFEPVESKELVVGELIVRIVAKSS